MINKNKWVLINNGENKQAISFKQIVKDDYNLIDIRQIDKQTEQQVLSIYLIGYKVKRFIFENRKDALKYLFDKYSFLIEMKGGLKENERANKNR